jgi:hypothetical protein
MADNLLYTLSVNLQATSEPWEVPGSSLGASSCICFVCLLRLCSAWRIEKKNCDEGYTADMSVSRRLSQRLSGRRVALDQAAIAI